MAGIVRVMGGGALVTACKAPAGIALSRESVAPKEEVALSWQGAKGGAGNPIVGYAVYRDGVLHKTLETQEEFGSLRVIAPDANGKQYVYHVVTLGKIKGFDSVASAKKALTCFFTAPSAPSSVLISGGEEALTYAGAQVTLAWAGAAAGTNNPITGYAVYRDGVLYSTMQSTAGEGTLPVPANAKAGGKYTYTVRTAGAYATSEYSAGRSVYTYGNPTAPTSITLSTEKADAKAPITINWSGAGAGALNPITGYRILRATNAEGPYIQFTQVMQTGTSGSATVYAHETMGSSYYYKIVTLGALSNSAQSANTAIVTSIVYTKAIAPTSITISKEAAGYNKSATLYWSGAAGGENNAMQGYKVYRSVDGGEYALLTTIPGTQTSGSVTVTAGAVAEQVYRYYIVTLGTKEGFDSAPSSIVSLTAKERTYTDYYYTASQTIAIPTWAEALHLTCIGGGGGSGGVAYDYGEGVAASGGGGGTGEKTDRVLNVGEFTPGASIVVTVGSAGTEGGAWSPAGSGGNSSFGAFLSARGGTGGSPGVTQWGAYGRGGAGGNGGIGGSPGRSPLGENYGAYGDSFHSDFKNWTDAQWYMFGDASTGRRLGVAGKGGAPKGGAGPGANGRGNTTLPGTWYGTGGGGRNWWGATGVWWASAPGIVGMRVYRYMPA